MTHYTHKQSRSIETSLPRSSGSWKAIMLLPVFLIFLMPFASSTLIVLQNISDGQAYNDAWGDSYDGTLTNNLTYWVLGDGTYDYIVMLNYNITAGTGNATYANFTMTGYYGEADAGESYKGYLVGVANNYTRDGSNITFNTKPDATYYMETANPTFVLCNNTFPGGFPGSNKTFTFDITNIFNKAKSLGYTNLKLYFYVSDPVGVTTADNALIYSLEAPYAVLRPTIMIEYADVPPVSDTRTFSVTLNSNTSSYTNKNITDDPVQIWYNATQNYTIAIPDMIGYWNLDNNTFDYYGNYNATGTGYEFLNGVFDKAINFSDTERISTQFNPVRDGMITNQLTLSLWFKTTQNTTTDYIAGQILSSAADSFGFYKVNTGYVKFRLQTTTAQVERNIQTKIDDGIWRHYAATYNGSHLCMYANAEPVTACINVTGNVNNSYPAANFTIGGRPAPLSSLGINKSIDDVRLYNRSLSTQEIAFLYQSTYPKYNCSVSLDGVIVNRTTYQNITANTQSIYIDTTGYEEAYDIQLACYDGFSSIGTLTNNATNVFIDTIEPSINSMTIPNNTILFRHLDTLNLSIKGNDINLYAVNGTIYKLNSSGSRTTAMFQYFNQNMTGSQKLNMTFNYSADINNNASWTAGRYEIEMMAWDSHTAKDIPDYSLGDVTKTIEGIPYYGFEYNGAVRIYSNDYTDKETYKALSKDKYTFGFDYNVKDAWHTIYLEADEEIIYLQDSDYQNHFVIGLTNWVDFVSKDYSDSIVTRIDDHLYKIEILGTEKKILFESIGDLNTNIRSIYFNVSEPYIFRAQDHFTDAFLANFTIELYNGTTIAYNKTASGYNVSFNLTEGYYQTNITMALYARNGTLVNLTPGGNFTFDMYAAESLYILFYDEITDQTMAGINISYTIINYQNETKNGTTDDGYVFESGFAPGTYELRYASSDYPQRSYFTTISSSSTQILELFMLSSSNGTYTNFVIEDETGNLLEGATLKVYRHFSDCNCFKIVEMDKSNFNGVASLTLQHYDGKYKFIVEYNGATIYASSALEGYRITESTYSLAGTLLGDTYQSYYATTQAYTSLNYSNASKLFYYTINDPTGLTSQFCLFVDEMTASNANGSVRVCSNCLNASSGTLTCNVSSRISSGHELIAKGWLHTNTRYSPYYTDILSELTSYVTADTLGKTGIFFGLMLTLTIAMAGVAIAGLNAGIVGALTGLGISMGTGLIMLGLPTYLGLLVIGILIMALAGGMQK